MQPVLDTFYARWRVETGAVALLRDDDDSPPEALLQSIWQHQRLRREQLKTLDGVAVRVLHPGFRNWEGGPDFRGAMVQVGDEVRTGDIEVDLRPSGWRAHGHDRNPNFRNVILHVIWDGERAAAGGPATIAIRSRLDAPLGELSLWLGGQPAQAVPEAMRGRCCRALKGLTGPALSDFLHEAGRVRLQSKAARFRARAAESDWDQALWEGLFRALGYKQNVWPMQRLAELRNRCIEGSQAIPGIEARLFGLSGLLPVELPRKGKGADEHVRRLWDNWWRDRDALFADILPRTVWRLNGLRPANHPHRRLALGAHWLADSQLPSRLLRWCSRDFARKDLAPSLLTILQPAPDDFWDFRFTLNSARTPRRLPLLGDTRVTDLAVNVVLPWAWARISAGPNNPARERIESRYQAWPAAQDNSVLKLARQRLLGGAGVRALPGAAAQQGLMQIVNDFCETSNALCDDCRLPRLVYEWLEQASDGQSLTHMESGAGTRVRPA